MKKYLSLFIIAVLALALTACGGKSASEEAAPDDGQNPVMNYVGNYICGRAAVLIGATDEEDGASASVKWSSSAAENSTWEMTGIFDPEEKRFEYHDCVRTDFVYKEDGSVDKQTEVYTGGHGFMFFDDSGDKLTMTWQDDQEDVAKDMVFEFATAPAEGEASTGMANPWQTADSSEAAAQGAGLDGFSVPDDITLSIGEVKPEVCRYMDGLAEVSMPVGAVEMTIRKGRADLAVDDMGISGDYNEYAHDWTQSVKGLEIHCFGNEEGRATRTIWQVDDTCWSIVVQGLGGDENYGLSADDLNSIINAMQ
jgi:hypothetical protein